MKSIYETLAALSTGAVLLAGCAGAQAPINATDVPGASEVKPSVPSKEAVEQVGGAAAAGALDKSAAPAMPAGAAPVVGAASAVKPGQAAPPVAGAAAKAAAPVMKKKAAKKDGATGSCGEGTCS